MLMIWFLFIAVVILPSGPGCWWSDLRPANGQFGQTDSPGTHEHLHTSSPTLLADLLMFGVAYCIQNDLRIVMRLFDKNAA